MIDLTIFGIFVLIASMVIAISLHEAVHAYVGYLLGDTTAKEEGRLSLNPIRHIDPLMTIILPIFTLLQFHTLLLAAKPVPFNPYHVKYREFGAALIAIAGPVSNLVLALIVATILRILPLEGGLASALHLFIELNISLFVFNLVPIPPLDGSRVLYAFAPEPIQQFMRSMERYGIIIAFMLVAIGLGSILAVIDQAIYNAIV